MSRWKVQKPKAYRGDQVVRVINGLKYYGVVVDVTREGKQFVYLIEWYGLPRSGQWRYGTEFEVIE